MQKRCPSQIVRPVSPGALDPATYGRFKTSRGTGVHNVHPCAGFGPSVCRSLPEGTEERLAGGPGDGNECPWSLHGRSEIPDTDASGDHLVLAVGAGGRIGWFYAGLDGQRAGGRIGWF